MVIMATKAGAEPSCVSNTVEGRAGPQACSPATASFLPVANAGAVAVLARAVLHCSVEVQAAPAPTQAEWGAVSIVR